MKIDSQMLLDLLHGDYEGQDWELLEDELTDTWRWGIDRRAILRHTTEESTLWGVDYRVETSHDEYRIDFTDDSEVELWKAVAVPVTKIEYQEDKS